MSITITTGKMNKPIRALVYGPEGIGKTTFASQFPKPLFVDAEDGSGHLNVSRTQRPTSWTMLKGIVEELSKDAQGYKTLVIDTADWADKLASAEICAKGGKNSIEDFGYGKGWVMLSEEWKRLLDQLSELQAKQGFNVVFLSHAALQKVEQPDEMGSYDRYALKMEKKSASLLKEWVDLMIFANYKTIVIETSEKKRKAQGGQRVMYTSHHPCWDAKNRFDLPDELPFEFTQIAKIFAVPSQDKTTHAKQPEADTPKQETKPVNGSLPQCLPSKLRDLMAMSAVTVDELMSCCRKTYPEGTPVENVEAAFWEGKIIPGWDKILIMVSKHREQTKQAA